MTQTLLDLESRVALLEKRIRRGRLAGTLVCVMAIAIVLSALQEPSDQGAPGRFTEIDVERLNIVEPDGTLALVIANKPRLPDVIVGGVEHDTGRKGTRGPGMLFFNHKGDECGGLTYSSFEREGEGEESGGYRAGAHFSFDQYQNDQVVFLSYQDDGTSRRSGLYVVDRPTHPNIHEVLEMRRQLAEGTPEEQAKIQNGLREAQARGELGAQRVFVGSDSGAALVRLRDSLGRDRLRMSVDGDNEACIEFLDEEGVVVLRLPENGGP
jgi:hypothetical protein